MISLAALLLGAMAARHEAPETADVPARVAERWLLALRSQFLGWPADEQAEILASLRAYRDAVTDPESREDVDAVLRLLLAPMTRADKRSASRKAKPRGRRPQRGTG